MKIIACKDAEHQAEQMTRDEWYTLYVSARGIDLP
ncbi:MAG: Aldo/keto reductase [Bacilli bacterium]|nr:Aldo/keto reductase [Bacilli bacterium]